MTTQKWTEEDQRDAEAFAKGFVALMIFARAQGVMVGFITPTAIVPPELAEEDKP
jgi:hypothetical protein